MSKETSLNESQELPPARSAAEESPTAPQVPPVASASDTPTQSPPPASSSSPTPPPSSSSSTPSLTNESTESSDVEARNASSLSKGNKLRTSGIFKPANLSGVFNLNNLPSSSFNISNPHASNNNNTNTNSNNNNNNNNNSGSALRSSMGASLNRSALSSSGGLRASTGTPPLVDKDLLCPICLDIMKEAFITRCGHSFCYLCIVKHLQSKQNCPSCSVYLTREQVFPNFIFNKIVEKSKGQAPNSPALSASTSMHLKQLQSSILSDSDIGISEINSIMQVLLDKKKMLEAEDQSIEMEVLLDFLNATKKRKMEALHALQKELSFLDSDIERVAKLKTTSPSQDMRKGKKRSIDEVDGDLAESPRYGKESLEHQKKQEAISAKKQRVEEHLEDLQACYFESCKKIENSEDKKGSADVDDGSKSDRYSSPHLSRFTQNMNKFTKYSNFKVLGTLKYGDIFNQSSIVSSIEFDRDDEFFATAGVTKKIKIFDYNAIIRDTIDMHYPISEMCCKSKISCLSWNAYIKSQIASSDYEGIVSLWDATTSQIFSQLEEHEKRVWSVDFSKCDPTQLASGSDDTKVKIWSTSAQRSIATIESKANICCVKWNPTSPYLLAFGSADHHIHYYDLRAAKEPLFVFRGHKKAVSYVKFMSKDEIVSASTDSTLKLWKNGQTECVRTFSGHINEKNFVGLAVNGDYVCCGSENNGVYSYYKMMSKPVVGYKFGSSNPITGEEMEDDATQFVSSVCWRKESNVLLAANSQGTIKILELV